jgi:predicted RNase H-like HicB family nuclease
MTFPLTAYIEAALELARYDKLEDGSFAGEIPKLKGVVAFGGSLRECENELRSTLEDWLLVGLRLGHSLPVLAGIDLNKVKHGRVATTQKA